MYPNSIYFGRKVVPRNSHWAKVYTIWVHGPLYPKPLKEPLKEPLKIRLVGGGQRGATGAEVQTAQGLPSRKGFRV